MKRSKNIILMILIFTVIFTLLFTGCAKNPDNNGNALTTTGLSENTTIPDNSPPVSVPVEGAITLLTVNSDKAMGTVTGGGIQSAGEPVTVTATAKSGYVFSGWYYGETLVGNEIAYTFIMPDIAYTLTARFAKAFKLTATTADNTMGTVTGSGEYAADVTVMVTATSSTGYIFVGWYDGDTLVNDALTYTFTMPENDYTLTARFEAVH